MNNHLRTNSMNKLLSNEQQFIEASYRNMSNKVLLPLILFQM